MKDKFGMRMLAILCAIAIVASSMAIYSYISIDVEKGIGEGGGRDVFSLMPPPFICAASASELDGVGDAFPEDEAGISSYVNVCQSISITDAINAYIQLEELSQTHAIGIIEIDNRIDISSGGSIGGTRRVHVYVDTEGYVVAYFKKSEPASLIIKWSGMGLASPKINDFTTNAAIEEMCSVIGVSYPAIEDDIQYYDFEYPEAQKMLIFVNTICDEGTEYTHIFLPDTYSLYESSYYNVGSSHSVLYLDEASAKGWWGYYELSLGEPHTIKLKSSGSAGVGTILIYTEG